MLHQSTVSYKTPCVDRRHADAPAFNPSSPEQSASVTPRAAARTACDPLWERHYCVSLASCDARSVSVPDLEDSRGLGFIEISSFSWNDSGLITDDEWSGSGHMFVSRGFLEKVSCDWNSNSKLQAFVHFRKTVGICELFNNDQAPLPGSSVVRLPFV